MTKDEKRQVEILDKLYSAIKVFNQGSIFGPPSDTTIINSCIEYLRFSGYTVTEPNSSVKEVKSIDELIAFFYDRLNRKRGNHGGEQLASHKQGRDRNIASAFVNSRMELTGNSFMIALQECVDIVKTVVDHESEFRFRYVLSSFSVFGQKNLKWVSEKAIDIMNRKIGKKVEEQEEALADEVIASQDTSDLGYTDLDILLQQLEENGNGKSESKR